MFGILPFQRNEDNLFDVFDKFFSQSKVDLPAFRTDIKNEEEAFLLEAELPGFRKEDIALDLKEGILTIRAQSREEKEKSDESGSYVRRERHCGAVSRSFDVSGIDEEKISAQYQDGILRLRLPKLQPVLPESRSIDIQ